MEELSIKVNIADRLYPLSVTREQEETVRKAAKLINDKLKALQQQFAVQDKQDMLAMTVLEVTTTLLQLQDSSAIKDKDISLELDRLWSMLKGIKL